jgi:hypothetical protein
MGRWVAATALIVFAALAMIGCGSTTTTAASTAGSLHSTNKDVAAGRLEALPSGSVFMRVIHFNQAAGTSFGSELHQQGMLFEAGGQQTLHIETDPPALLLPGTGIFSPSRRHIHENSGTTANDWYFLALWPSAIRGKALVNPAAHILYESPDVPGGALVTRTYTETIRLVTIGAGGRTGAARYGGLTTIFVLDGSVQLHAAGQPVASMDKGQSTYQLPGVAVQAFNTQNVPSHLLIFFATGAGEPFETPVNTSP